MGLSKRYIDHNDKDLPFSITTLAFEMEKQVPEIVFAYLLGSAAKTGTVKAFSDIDIAVYLEGKPESDLYFRISGICENLIGFVRCDLGILNDAEPVFCFEAIKGNLLFAKNKEIWLDFYSRTCRKYESTMYHYEKQKNYRIEAGNAI